MSGAAPEDIYPRYCFDLSPTANTWCLLRVSEISQLARYREFEGENFFFYRRLPIKWVRIVGVVVAVDEFAGRRVFTIDDSSGVCIEVMINIPIGHAPHDNIASASNNHVAQLPNATEETATPSTQRYDEVVAGSVVDVKGKLSVFREEFQIKIEKLVTLSTTQQEVTLWEKRDKFRREVLDKSWILRKREIRQCRKDALQTEEEEQRKKRRIKAITASVMSRDKNAEEEEEAAGAARKTAQEREQLEREQQLAKERDRRRAEAAHRQRLIQRSIGTGKYSALGL